VFALVSFPVTSVASGTLPTSRHQIPAFPSPVARGVPWHFEVSLTAVTATETVPALLTKFVDLGGGGSARLHTDIGVLGSICREQTILSKGNCQGGRLRLRGSRCRNTDKCRGQHHEDEAAAKNCTRALHPISSFGAERAYRD
jgi:hypothetical protein